MSFLVVLILVALLLLISAIAFLRAKDVFAMTHVVLIANSYIVPLFLFVLLMENFSLIACVKIVTIAVISFLVSQLLCRAIIRRAILSKISPDAENKNTQFSKI